MKERALSETQGKRSLSLCLVGRGSARGDKDRVPAKKSKEVIVGHDGGDFSTSLEMTGEGMLEMTGEGWPPSSE